MAQLYRPRGYNPALGFEPARCRNLAGCCLLAVAGYGGWHAWRRYQYKRYMQEHGELTPNTPKQPDGGVAPDQLPLGNGAPLPLRLPQQAP